MKRGGKKTPEQSRLKDLVAELRTLDCSIERSKLDLLLSFGQEAVPYLEALVREALQTSSQAAAKRPQNTDWFVVVHALYLLAHLGAEDSLELVLKFLGQKQEILDYWLHDLLTEDIWELPFLLGQNRLQTLEDFVLDKENNPFSRLAVCTALIQIALIAKERSREIRQIFVRILNLKDEDPDFIGLVISELTDWLDMELKPVMLAILNRGGIWAGIVSATDIEWCYKRNHPRQLRPMTLHERYDHFGEHSYFSKSTGEAPKRILLLRKSQKSL